MTGRMRWAALALALLACAPSDGRLAVSRRVSGEALTLRTETRNALPADAPLELPVAPGDRRLLYSVALETTPDCDRGSALFTLSGRRDGRWTLLDSTEIRAGEARWQDRQLALDAGVELLRLEAALRGRIGPGCRAALQPWWGSPLLLGDAAPGTTPSGAALPNIVLLSLDTLGASYLSSFENAPGVSPHLDAFLAEGFSFRRAFAPYGYTLPSHASLFTGLAPVRHGIYLPEGRFQLPSLVERFAEAGYLTAAFTEGGLVSGLWGFARGFDRYGDGSRGLGHDAERGARETFEEAGAWLAEVGAASRFLLFVHTYEVHLPYEPADREALEVARRLSPGVARFFRPHVQVHSALRHNRGEALLSEREIAHLRALHSAEIQLLDRVVARFLGQLEALGLAESTLVVITADHGDQFGEQGFLGHGDSLHNRVLHVPLGFRWPGRVPSGRSEAPVQLVDVLPTILELVGLESPADLDGTSLLPLVKGEVADGDWRPAISEMRHARGACVRLGQEPHCRLDRLAVQDARFKLVLSGLPPGQQLYDLQEDPEESRDVSAERPEVLARLQAVGEAHRALPEAVPRSAGPGPADVADDLRERLRALGYLD